MKGTTGQTGGGTTERKEEITKGVHRGRREGGKQEKVGQLSRQWSCSSRMGQTEAL